MPSKGRSRRRPRERPEAPPAARSRSPEWFAGFAAGVLLRREALARAERELVAFKAKDHEFYSHVRDTMVAFFDERASKAPNIVAAEMDRAKADVLRRDMALDERAVLEQLRKARSFELKRKLRDAQLAPRFADLICDGEVTKTAAVKLGIGIEQAKRVRSLAVELGLLDPRRKR